VSGTLLGTGKKISHNRIEKVPDAFSNLKSVDLPGTNLQRMRSLAWAFADSGLARHA
jgi:hypothetical protein